MRWERFLRGMRSCGGDVSVVFSGSIRASGFFTLDDGSNAAAPAMTRCRLGCMLALLSMSKPTVTGVSVSVKRRTVCARPSSTTLNASCGKPATYAPFLSLTVTCRTTSSESALKTGASWPGTVMRPGNSNAAATSATHRQRIRVSRARSAACTALLWEYPFRRVSVRGARRATR